MSAGSYAYNYKKTMILALPIVMSQVGQVTVGLVDTMMIGRVGTAELAASAFVNNLFMFGMLFGMGITIGITPIIGDSYSQGKLDDMKKWLKNGFATHSVTAIILTVFLLSLYFLIPYMGQTDKVVSLAKPYYLWLCASYFPMMLFFSVKQFMEGIGNTKYAMQITIISNLTNIFFNYVFIFGKLGFPELGLIGAGIGTFIARLVMPALWLIYFRNLPKVRTFFIEAYREALDWKLIKKLLAVGIPIGMQIVIEVSAFAIGAIMMGWMGETELAAHQVAIGLAGFTFMICLGISQATTIRVSHQMGLKDRDSIRIIAYTSIHLVLLFMTITAISFVLLRNVLPYIFTSDPEVVRIASGLLIVAAFFQLFDGLQVVVLNILRGMRDVTVPMYIALFAYLLIAIPVSYSFAFIFNHGPSGIWYGYLVGLGIAGVMFFKRFQKRLKKV